MEKRENFWYSLVVGTGRLAAGMLYALGEGILCDWLGELIFLSLASPKLEVGAKLGNLAG